MADNLSIFKPIWETASPDFQHRIPEPTKENWERIGTLIGSEQYTQERNEIFDKLVNLIAKQKVWLMSIKNPLSRFKSGTLSYGDTYEEIMSDVIAGQTFNIGKDDQFEKFKNNVYSAYHKINREQYYPVTVEETHIVRAFRTENGLQSLINSLVNQMYSSNDLDEFILTKRLMDEYYSNEDMPILSTQVINVPDVRDNLLDTERMKAFIMCCKGTLKQLTFPKREYNPNRIMMQAKPSDMIIMLDSSITIASEVATLSQAFHPSYMDVNVPIVDIDCFEGKMKDDNIIGVICHKEWLRIFDHFRAVRTAENGRNLYRNYFYHIHQLYAASPFVPVVFLKGETE